MPVVAQWKVRPPLDVPRAGLWLGSGRPEGDGVWLGTLAESVSGKQPRVWLATGKEQVVAVVGKRGSGKSFTLGVLIEGLVSGADTELGRQAHPRAVLVFDPLDIYWTTRFAVGPSTNAEAQRHFELAKAAGLPSPSVQVEAWVPGAAARRETDPDWFQTLELSVPDMGLSEWELLLGVSVLSEPMGQAFADSLQLIRNGYTLRNEEVPPRVSFDLSDLAQAVRADDLTATYHPESLRALRQRLTALASSGLFSSTGTTVRDLLAPGRATIVLLNRLPQSYRTAIVSLVTRMLMEEREKAAFAEKRLALDPDLKGPERERLETAASQSVPRTVVVLDEAQAFLAPGERTSARELFVRLVKEGRNMGMSAILATQQPSALDSRVLSQVEAFIAHQLVTEADIRAVRDNLKSSLPDSIQFGSQYLDESGLLRQLPPGSCLVSAADMNTTIRRSIVASIRPRASVHGGIEL